MVDVRDGRVRSRTRTGVHLARRGAGVASTAAAGPTGVAVRLARTGLGHWRRQRETLAADTRQRKAAIADAVGPRRRRRWPWVLGALVLAGGIGAVVSVARPTPPPPPAAHPPRVDDPTPVDRDAG